MDLYSSEENPEEKHDRVTRILETNSKVHVICIACKNPIIEDQNILSTQYGPYHDEPMTCAEDGDPNYDDRDFPYS